MEGALGQFITVVPDALSRGLIGLGGVAIIAFLFLRKREWYNTAAYLVLVGITIGAGVWLEAKKLPLPSPSPSVGADKESQTPSFACTNASGEFGRVVLYLNIFNADRSSHGYGQSGLPNTGQWLISSNQVKNIEQNTSSFKAKRWGARWDCVVGNN